MSLGSAVRSRLLWRPVSSALAPCAADRADSDTPASNVRHCLCVAPNEDRLSRGSQDAPRARCRSWSRVPLVVRRARSPRLVHSWFVIRPRVRSIRSVCRRPFRRRRRFRGRRQELLGRENRRDRLHGGQVASVVLACRMLVPPTVVVAMANRSLYSTLRDSTVRRRRPVLRRRAWLLPMRGRWPQPRSSTGPAWRCPRAV